MVYLTLLIGVFNQTLSIYVGQQAQHAEQYDTLSLAQLDNGIFQKQPKMYSKSNNDNN